MHLVSSPSSSPLFLLPRLWSLTALANGPLRRGSCVCPVGAICMHNCTIYSRLTRFPLLPLLPSSPSSLQPPQLTFRSWIAKSQFINANDFCHWLQSSSSLSLESCSSPPVHGNCHWISTPPLSFPHWCPTLPNPQAIGQLVMRLLGNF